MRIDVQLLCNDQVLVLLQHVLRARQLPVQVLDGLHELFSIFKDLLGVETARLSNVVFVLLLAVACLANALEARLGLHLPDVGAETYLVVGLRQIFRIEVRVVQLFLLRVLGDR